MIKNPCYVIQLIMNISQLSSADEACQELSNRFYKKRLLNSPIAQLPSIDTVSLGQGQNILEKCCSHFNNHLNMTNSTEWHEQNGLSSPRYGYTLLIMGFSATFLFLLLGLLLYVESRISNKHTRRVASSSPPLRHPSIHSFEAQDLTSFRSFSRR